MDRLYNKAWFFCLLGFLSPVVFAQQETALGIPDIIISTGEKSGPYWNAGERLRAVAAEMNLVVENLPSDDSMENLDRLLDELSPVNMALVPADALQHFLLEHPEARRSLEFLESMGQECIFIVTGVDSKIRDEEDFLEADKLRLAIPASAVVVAARFGYMSNQIPTLKKFEVTPADTREVMDDLDAPDSPVDAIMLVSRPRKQTEDVRKALENPERYRIVELSDERLTEPLEDGRQIYRSIRLGLPGASAPVRTICSRGLLLSNKEKLSSKHRNQLTDLVSYQWMRVYVTP